MKEFVSAVQTEQDAQDGIDDDVVPFRIDGREYKAHRPSENQLLFMMAALGRGQSDSSRMASIINLMLETLDDDDRDHLEGRLLTRDRKERLDPKIINDVFEYLTEEWFARPTKSQSDSAPSEPKTGP